MCLLYSHTSALAREMFYVPSRWQWGGGGGGGNEKEERKEARRCRIECPGRKGLLRPEGTLQLTLSRDCLCLGVEWAGQECSGSASWTYSFFFLHYNKLSKPKSISLWFYWLNQTGLGWLTQKNLACLSLSLREDCWCSGSQRWWQVAYIFRAESRRSWRLC